MKKILNFVIKVSISIALLIFLFSRIDLRKTIFYIRGVQLPYFICAFLLFLFLTFLGLVRWNVLLKILKKDLSYGRIFSSFCGGLFFNVFLPSSIGGDIARTVDLSVHTKDGSSIFATVFLDRLSGFVGLSLIALLGFFYGYFSGLTKDLILFLYIIILTIIIIFASFVIFNKRVFNFVNKIIVFEFLRKYLFKFHNCCYLFWSHKKALLNTIFLSILIQGFFSIVFYFIGLSLGIRLNIIYFLILIPIITTVTILPISIGGLGLRDNAAVILFSSLGVASDKIVAMTLLIFLFLFFVGALGGIIYGIALLNRRL